MTRRIVFLTAVMLCVVAGRAVGDITYVLNQYPDYQIDTGSTKYNLIGSITTDGTIGALSISNIVSWQYSTAAEDASRTVAFNSTDAAASVAITGQVIATASQIQVPRFTTITGSVINNLSLIGKDASTQERFALEWQTGAFLTVAVLSEQFGFAASRAQPLGDPWLQSSSTGSALSLPQSTGSIVVATTAVPEPLSIGYVGIVGAVIMLRQRRTA